MIKNDDKPHADVIDGRQRLTTLTILFAVVTSYLTGDNRSSCYKYLREPGNELEGLAPLPRLHLRQKDQDFFHKYIQYPGTIRRGISEVLLYQNKIVECYEKDIFQVQESVLFCLIILSLPAKIHQTDEF